MKCKTPKFDTKFVTHLPGPFIKDQNDKGNYFWQLNISTMPSMILIQRYLLVAVLVVTYM